LEKGEIVHIDPPKTIADGAQTPHLGELTFEIMKKNVDGIFTVTDE
jgi:threo-3-hydroxy-L-aspartate ammonia-lyase